MEIIWILLGLFYLRKPPAYDDGTKKGGIGGGKVKRPLSSATSQALWINGNPAEPPFETQLLQTLGTAWSQQYVHFYAMWLAVDGVGTDEEALFKHAKQVSAVGKEWMAKRTAWWYWDSASAAWVDTSSSLAWHIEDDLDQEEATKMHGIIPAVKD